ncbi:MAG TPA: copper amine oxidase N-terminal domain-containing protein, partial [Candidatus Monoglobus merdigallinarum]|nr:copper amine oxidase N-terminal domain-containing protein [Candidatus Monoglobus merdigallinarum]
MKERLQGVLAGVLIGVVGVGSIAYAASETKMIEVLYDNVKVYKDNVLCELKDTNGSVIEPFIYNGTTYMPVRGTANLADMQVTWDGNTKSVYLWDELVPDGTYLMEVCPPYETSSNYEAYLQSEGKSFTMSGTKYSNGFKLCDCEDYALFNLNSRYS